MNESFLSVVIPTFNEQNRIVQTLDQLLFYFSSKDYSWEIVVSDDGSNDLTVKLIEEWAQKYSNIHIVLLPHKGKGWAVKNGMLQSSGKYRLMFDADMAMHPNEIDKFLDQISIDHIVLETDAPYLAPSPFRGKRNQSEYLVYILKKLTEIYRKSEKKIAAITTKNALSVFKF